MILIAKVALITFDRIVERRREPVMGLFNESSLLLSNSRSVSLELQNGYPGQMRYSDTYSSSQTQNSL